MLTLGISQAQAQFTKLLDKKVTIIDKKSKKEKAVILPYSEYIALLNRVNKKDLKEGTFSKFVGLLDKNFKTNDPRYQEIVKWKYF